MTLQTGVIGLKLEISKATGLDADVVLKIKTDSCCGYETSRAIYRRLIAGETVY